MHRLSFLCCKLPLASQHSTAHVYAPKYQIIIILMIGYSTSLSLSILWVRTSEREMHIACKCNQSLWWLVGGWESVRCFYKCSLWWLRRETLSIMSTYIWTGRNEQKWIKFQFQSNTKQSILGNIFYNSYPKPKSLRALLQSKVYYKTVGYARRYTH